MMLYVGGPRPIESHRTPRGFLCFLDVMIILVMGWGWGWGWGGVGIIPNVSLATLRDLHLHPMLRYMIFTCT